MKFLILSILLITQNAFSQPLTPGVKVQGYAIKAFVNTIPNEIGTYNFKVSSSTVTSGKYRADEFVDHYVSLNIVIPSTNERFTCEGSSMITKVTFAKQPSGVTIFEAFANEYQIVGKARGLLCY
jgi:hypothetical protein